MGVAIITATKPLSDRLTFRDVLQSHETRLSSAFGIKFGNDLFVSLHKYFIRCRSRSRPMEVML
jgi:hypothetical protein